MDNLNLDSNSVGFKLLKSLGLILIVIAFYFLGQGITFNIFQLILGDKDKLMHLLSGFDNSTSAKFVLLGMQASTHLIGFILIPILYIHYFNKNIFSRFFLSKKHLGKYLIVAATILIISIPLVGWMSDWNKAIHLPEFLNPLGDAFNDLEEKAKRLTEIIGYYHDVLEFIFTLLVMAVIPAIGEELVFRGIMQNEFASILKNSHAAIWITGFLFSALHFQFAGFFPRMFLGVTFGYLYFWSGNILVSMFVHFLNNAITLITMNLYKQKVINIDPESAESIPAISIIISLLIFSILLFTFKRINKDQTFENS